MMRTGKTGDLLVCRMRLTEMMSNWYVFSSSLIVQQPPNHCKCQTSMSRASQEGTAVAPKGKLNIFDAAHEKQKKAAMPVMADELEHYLSIEPDVNIDNPVVWWSSSESCKKYPMLLRMACSHLTIPCKSTC